MTNKLVSKRELEISLTMRPVWELKDLFNLIGRMPLVNGGFTRHGHWVIEPGETVMHCNSCGWAYEYYGGLEEEWNYCPHCGAIMNEVEKDETD